MIKRNSEIEFLMEINSGGIVIKEGAQAYLEMIREWLYTRVNSRYGNPGWGNSISQYKHEPTSSNVECSVENSILLKLAEDIPNFQVTSIRCESVNKDIYKVSISTSLGNIQEEVDL